MKGKVRGMAQEKGLYPIIATHKLAKTINFYEDFFNFAVEQEIGGFALLQSQSKPEMRIGVVSLETKALPEELRTLSYNSIISIPHENIQESYDNFYMEGLELVDEPSEKHCGQTSFFVRDPNGVLLHITDNAAVDQSRSFSPLATGSEKVAAE